MTEHEASRTLVKSPPELWAECSEAASLTRHLGEFGEIRITRLEPETAVAWEGEEVSGTVRLEPSGWGTRVILTACATEQHQAPPPAPETDEAPIQEPEPADPEFTEAVAGEPSELDEPDATDDAPAPPAPEPEPEPPPPAATASPSSVASTPATADLERPARRVGLIARLMALFQPPEPAAASAVSPSTPAPATGTSSTPPPTAQPASAPAPISSSPPPTPRPAAVPRPAANSLESIAATAQPAVLEEPPDPEPGGEVDHAAVLTAALDSLGQAHHRPYSRA